MTSQTWKRKVYVLKDLPGKCPYCSNSLSNYSFGISRTKKIGGKYCASCHKYFLTVRLYNHYSKIFECMNLQEAKPLIQELKEKQQEKHEKKMEKRVREKNLKDNEVSFIDNKIKEANLNGAPSWNMIKSFPTEALGSMIVAYLVNINSNNTLRTARWYFVSSMGRRFKRYSDSIYLFGSETMMGRTLLENCSNGEKSFKILNDVYYVNAVIVFREDRYIQLIPTSAKNTGIKEELKKTENHVVYVYFRLNNKCIADSHHIDTVTAQTTNIKTGLSVEVNVFYCRDCRKYFINYEALKKYVSNGIYPGLQFVFAENNVSGLREASELMIYGYTVRDGELTKEQRQRILSWIIDAGLLTKAEVIKDLQFKISYNGKKAGNEKAKKKWEEDIEFVSRYVKGNTLRIDVTFRR